MKDYGTNVSFPLLSLLGLLFVGLKLTGYIAWSWWWVTLPFWGGLALLLAVAIGAAALAGILTAVIDLIERRR